MMHKKIMYDVKGQLLDIKQENNHDEKINKCVVLLNYLNDTNLEEIKHVIDIFSNGILDDCDNEKITFDDQKYFSLLFPTVKYEIIPKKIRNENLTKNIVEDKISVNDSKSVDEQQIKIIEDYYIDIEPDTTQIIEIKNSSPIILCKDYVTHNNTCNEPIIVFHNYELHTFKKISFETSLDNSVLDNVAKTYNLNKVTKDKIKQMLNDNWTMEQIKDDETFNFSPFIIKINDNAYDIYMKNYSNETVEGIFYNTRKVNNEIKCIGNYGFLLL